jgi:ribosomal protein S18 acetylase RimI-like enzyme
MADTLDTAFATLRQMKTTLNGLERLRDYVRQGVGRQMLEELIDEIEKHLAEVDAVMNCIPGNRM